MSIFTEINHTKEDYQLIAKIAKKAVKLYSEYEVKLDYQSTIMDLEVVHHINPLKLQELLEANSVNFMHDITGINRHLNRETFVLEECFSPRCTS
jgi:hypothetical protein